MATSGPMSSMLNTKQDRKCYRVSAQDAQGSFQPVQLLMSPSKAEYNVKEALDWRAATRDDFKGMVYHPSNPVTDVTTAHQSDMTHRPLLLAIKDTGKGDGSVMLTGGTDCVVCLWSDSASARALGSKEACQGDGFELQARRRPR